MADGLTEVLTELNGITSAFGTSTLTRPKRAPMMQLKGELFITLSSGRPYNSDLFLNHTCQEDYIDASIDSTLSILSGDDVSACFPTHTHTNP